MSNVLTSRMIEIQLHSCICSTYNSMEHAAEFWLNEFWNKTTYFALSRSYMNHIPKAEELTVPLKKIPIDSRTNAFLDIEDEETTVSLYDGQTRRWNWALPTSYKSASYAGSGVGGRKGGMNREPGDWVSVANNRTEADLAESQPESTTDQTNSDSLQTPHAQFMVKKSCRNQTIPYLTIWRLGRDTIKAVCKLTTLSKTLDSKAYLLLKHQPWRHFTLFISLCNGYCDLCVHLYDHSGGVAPALPRTCLPRDRNLIEKAQIEEVIESSQLKENELSLPPAITEDMVPTPTAGDPPMCPPVIEVPKDPLNPEPVLELISKICVDKNTYNILEIIFSTQGLVGCGSVCYLARKDNEEYIIKDHWVLGGKKAVLNEINMMKKMEGIHGVPQLIEYWLIEVALGKVKDMRVYHYKFPYSIQYTFRTHIHLVLKPHVQPLHKFCSKVEFLSTIQDIVNIQRQVVEKHKVLHHDASLNNAIIKDDGDGSHGMLVDWEFVVDIVEGKQYVVSGTGTLPFMSQSLLFNLYLHTLDTSDERSGKRASGLRPYPVALIKHNYKDDYRGPLGMKHVLPKCTKENLNWITCEWSGTYEQCSAGKTWFFHHSDHYTAQLTKQFDPYFWDLLLLTLEWYNLIKDPASNKLSPGLLVLTWMLQGLSASKSPPPPPYSPSETVDPPSSRKQGKKDKAMKKGVVPASTSSCEVPNLQPSFSHRKPGSQFGFKQSLIPPGTDIHLQANNTLVATTKKPSDPTERPPALIYPTPKAPTTSTSVMHQADTNFYKNLDPALWSTADVCLESQDTASESSDSETTDNGDESDDDDNDGQDAHGDQEVGWGAAYGHHSAHPGFSKEAQPSQPLVTTALPTDFEFQHSHDEDDNAAMKSLVDDVTSSTDNASTPVVPADVLHLHHKRNGRPHPPNPVILDLLRQAETKDLKSKSKASCEGPKAMQLQWYGPCWKSFLEYVKGECCVQHAIENPFPKFVDNLPGSVNEALMSSLVEWLEGGVWPDQKHDMAKLLYEDLSTWRSDLKKIVTSIMPSLYDLILPSDIPPQECAAWVEEAVTTLLEDSTFLCYGVDELSKTQNAAHPVLREGVIAFFYTGSYHVTHRRPDIFQKQLPLECLALVCTAVKFFVLV
ncbi:hypothetical protein F4604DRAFT_1687831 [Suillus subluteus]|nr:hypothetical protein F4604DRAFT_1687831 [Suillus subluteus]